MKHYFLKLSKPFAFMRGSVAAFCCILLCSSANAQLTQQQITDAVYDALTTAPMNLSGQQINTVPWAGIGIADNAPLAVWLGMALGYTDFNANNFPSQGTILDLLFAIRTATERGSTNSLDMAWTNSISDVVTLLSSLNESQNWSTLDSLNETQSGAYALLDELYMDVSSISRGLDPTAPGEFANSLIYALLDPQYATPYLAKIRNLTYTQGSELRVHDEDSNWHLQSIALDADSILDELRTFNHDPAPEIVSNLTDMAQQITDGITDAIAEYWDEDPSSTISEAESDAEDETEESVSDFDDTIEGYDPSIEAPDTDSSYTDTDLADPNLNGLAPELNHGRTILLTPGFAFNPAIDFPRMEVDPLRNSDFAAFFDSITSTVRHVWQVLFVMGCIWIVRFRYRQIRMLLLSVTAPGFDSVASKAELEVTKAQDASHAGAGADVTLI